MSDQDLYDQKNNTSLRGKLYKQLREDILAGKYADHEELRENTIAKEYGVSRTPVREAIRKLELEGLVVTIPNKGAYVKAIDKKDIDDIYAIRALLEGLCAKWATEHISDKQLEQLEEILYITKYHIDKGHYDRVYEYDGELHNILYAASNSSILEHVLHDFHQYVQRARRHALTSPERVIKTYEEHLAIVTAIKEKDAGNAARLAKEHVRNVVANLETLDIENVIKK